MNYRTERWPVVTLSLIGINTLVYLVSLFFAFKTSGESELWIFTHLWLTPAESVWWTYLTSMFVHADFWHLLGNMIYLFLFGCCVEDMIGRVRFTVLYLVSGVISSLAYIAFSPGHFASWIPLGGASGAISACMGMYLLLRANADIEFKYFAFFLFFGVRAGEFELPAWMAISFWFLKDLFWMIIGMVYNHRGGGTAFGAHVGGLLAGLALVGIYKLVTRQKETIEATAMLEPVRVHTAPEKTPREPIRIRLSGTTVQPETQPQPAPSPTETPAIYLYQAEQQSGPFTLSQVQDMLQSGSVSQEALYWSEGLTDWQSVQELSG